MHEDLLTVHGWNWGVGAIVYLQKYLDKSSMGSTTQMAGYLSFLQ
ncbi:hypothetical protein A2U01_0067319, partial [Trifolium medium]|nr:hypothetical protein [Trifolium medium]